MADAIPLPIESEETWRPVVGYEGLYDVSDHGRVRRAAPGKGAAVAGRILRHAMSACTSRGRRTVLLYGKGKPRRFKVHFLVAEAFIGPRPAGLECNHKDGNGLNNRAGNLEWITQAANFEHAQAMGLNASRGIVNARKTHCPKGHPYDEANTYVPPVHGGRECRICRRASSAAYRRRQRERAIAAAEMGGGL